MVKHWIGLPREVLGSPSLELLKKRAEMTFHNVIQWAWMISEAFSNFNEWLCDPGFVTGLALPAAQSHQAGAGFKVTKLPTLAHPCCGWRSDVTNTLETHFSGPEVILAACLGSSGWSVSGFMLIFNHSLPKTEARVGGGRHRCLLWMVADTGSGLGKRNFFLLPWDAEIS